ncbi:putative ABC transport system ATP-binding protein [Virgibacillus halotolerans]|uniref:ABC transporter ATP-binding protein n=1 Tax=Virgibacillus halotolerans TaxID=1071053 RepID=UPI0019619973|nr:ABC transporter ATP-binding protein [Virgibacillus halotolerans]MBM7601480.1 putative ABC transport system ATP-binding protein [Virgibacillus halotolerans]
MNNIIKLENVFKRYVSGDTEILALRDVSFSIGKGEFIIILGASGAGKTTILNLLGGMDFVSEGSIFVEDEEINKYNERELTFFRRNKIGFVFQFYNLIPNLNALENVQFASSYNKDKFDAKEILSRVGLGERLNNFPTQLSGGEQQRVAIARAVAKNPTLLLCDEPTGALDYKTGKEVLKLLSQVNQDYDKTVIVITHNIALADMADKVIKVKSGEVEEIYRNHHKKDIDDIEW